MVPLKSILTNHRNRVVNVNENSRIFIVRGDFWKTASTAFKRASFDVSKHIKVIFVGEPCEDFGGPLLEMFTLLIHYIPLCGLFEGREGHYIPVHNTSRLNNGEYYTTGKMIATALVHGGRAPHCFSTSFAEYIVYGQVKTNPDPQDIPDFVVKEKILKVRILIFVSCNHGINMQISECGSDLELRELLNSEDFNFRFDCGFSKPSSTIMINEKETIISELSLHYIVLRVLGEIEQFVKGIKDTLNFDHLIKVCKC